MTVTEWVPKGRFDKRDILLRNVDADTSALPKDGLPLNQSLEHTSLADNQVKADRAKLRELMKQQTREDDTAPRIFNFDIENDKVQIALLEFLQRLSSFRGDKSIKREMTRDFMNHGVFTRRDGRDKAVAFFDGILHEGQASFFRDHEIEKRDFAVFLSKMPKMVPGYLRDMAIADPKDQRFHHLSLLMQEVDAPAKKIAYKVLDDVIDSNIPLDDIELGNLANNLDKLFVGKKNVLKPLLRKVLEGATEDTGNLLTSVANLANDVEEYQGQVFLEGQMREAEDTPGFDMGGGSTEMIDDPNALLSRATAELDEVSLQYVEQKQRYDLTHDLFRKTLEHNVDRITPEDLGVLLSCQTIDLEAQEALDDSDFNSFGLLTSRGIEIFDQKPRMRLHQVMDLVDQLPLDSKRLSQEEQFEILSQGFSMLHEQSFLNTEASLLVGAKMVEMDYPAAAKVFLSEMKENSPYRFSYDLLHFMVTCIGFAKDSSIKAEFKDILKNEYATQQRLDKSKRNLPLLLVLFDVARDYLKNVSNPETRKAMQLGSAKHFPMLSSFLSYGFVDFDEMLNMLEEACDNFLEADEEQMGRIREESETAAFQPEGDAGDFIIREAEELNSALLNVIAGQVSRRRDLPDDVISRKLLSHLVKMGKKDPDELKALSGRTKQFLDIQLKLAENEAK